jgi:hypothetical protein
LLLISFFVLFLAVYLFAIYMMKVVTRSSVATKELAVRFAFSLIPIAIAYHVAHYYTLLLVQGQSIIPALSDPFNMGWNLLGTALYEVNVGIIGAKSVWHTQVAVIVAGHVAAVYISHLMALNEYRSRRQALVSQLPMLAVMVAYTIAGLWILSQPLVLG